jgi:hypothetical protein
MSAVAGTPTPVTMDAADYKGESQALLGGTTPTQILADPSLHGAVSEIGSSVGLDFDSGDLAAPSPRIMSLRLHSHMLFEGDMIVPV